MDTQVHEVGHHRHPRSSPNVEMDVIKRSANLGDLASIRRHYFLKEISPVLPSKNDLNA